MYKQEKKRCYIGIGISVLLFILGQILLNYVSVLEKPFLGNTIYIVLGTSLILFSVIGIFFLIRHILHLNKKAHRKKHTKVTFLKDESRSNGQRSKA